MDIGRWHETDSLRGDNDAVTSDLFDIPLLDVNNMPAASTGDDVVVLRNPVPIFSPRGVSPRQEHTISLLSAVAAPFPSAKTVRRLLAAKADPNEASAIMVAATGGHVEVVDALLEAHADVNARDRYGHRALLPAAARGHAGVVAALLRSKAVVDARDRMGATALNGACALGQAHVVQVLLEAHANPNSTNLWDGSCLALAAGRGCVPAVRALIQANAALETRDASSRTALMEAARLDRLMAMSVLLDAGADVDARDRDGVSVLMSLCTRAAAGREARRERDADVSYWGGVWARGQEDGEDAQEEAEVCEQGSPSRVELLQRITKSSRCMDARDRWGRSALMHASASGWHDGILILLHAGADANVRDVNGRDMAELWPHKHAELLRLCTEAGRADVVDELTTGRALCCMAGPREGEGPSAGKWRARGEALVQACARGEATTVRALLAQWQASEAAQEEKDMGAGTGEAGEEGNAMSATGALWRRLWWARSGPTTALGAACAHGHASVVHEMIRARADIDARDADGATALLRAVRSGCVAAVQALLEASADVDVCAEDGESAIGIAVELAANARGSEGVAWSLLGALLGCGRVHQHYLDRGLLLAAEGASSRVVEALLIARADANASGKGGRTALIAATVSGCTATVAALLRHGARAQERDCRGVSALWAAVLGGHGDAAAALVQAGADVSEGVPAEEDEDNRGARVSMLHAAVRVPDDDVRAISGRESGICGVVRVVRALLRGRADVDTADGEGRTALMLAADSMRTSLVTELLEGGASVVANDSGGRGVLAYACGAGAIARTELWASASYARWRGPLRRRNGGLLAVAGGEGEETEGECVMALLQRGADPFATDASGMTALMWAACGQVVGLRVLLEYVTTLCGVQRGG